MAVTTPKHIVLSRNNYKTKITESIINPTTMPQARRTLAIPNNGLSLFTWLQDRIDDDDFNGIQVTLDAGTNPALAFVGATVDQILTLDLTTAGSYSNIVSGLVATNVQAAIDELAAGGAADGIYTGSGIVPTTTVATITDTLQFTGTNVGVHLNTDHIDLTFGAGADLRLNGSAGTIDYVLTAQPGGPPLWKIVPSILVDANEGLSYSGIYVQWGTTAAGTGAVDFTANRYIYLDTFNAQFGGSASNNILTIEGSTGDVGIGTANPIRNLDVSKDTVGSDVTVRVNNENNAHANSTAVFHAQVGGASAGDVYNHWQVTGATSWTAGIDNDDNDTWKLGPNLTPSTGTPSIAVTTAGAIQFGAYTTGAITGTSTDFLTTDAAGNVIQETISGSGIGGIYSGSGTAPAGVAVAVTDFINFDSNTLYIDGTGNNVGIGTASPTALLDLYDSATSFMTFVPATGFTYQKQLSQVHVSYFVTNPQTDFTSTLGTSPLPQGTSLLTDNGASFVNIGITRTSGGDGGVRLFTAHPAGYFSWNKYFSGVNTELARMTGDGLLGIGTTSPDRLFHVETEDGAGNTVLPVVRLTRTTSVAPVNGLGVSLEFETEGGAGNEVVATIAAEMTNIIGGSEVGALTFNVMRAGAAAGERLRIAGSGILSGADYGDLLAGHSGVGAVVGHIISDTNGQFLELTTAELITELGTGYGGIYSGSGTVPTSVVATLTDDFTISIEDAGTTTILPLLKLLRTSSGTPAAGLGSSLAFEVETTAANNEVLGTISTEVTTVTLGAEVGAMRFQVMDGGATANTKMSILGSGNVGIGTNAPLDLLHIETIGGAGITPSLTLSQDGGLGANWNAGTLNFYSQDTSATSWGGIGSIRVYAESAFAGNTPSYMSFYTHGTSANDGTLLGNTTERMRIGSTGQQTWTPYGVHTFTGTPGTYPAFVAATGAVIERTAAELAADLGAVAGYGGIYSGSGTVPTTVTATLTDTFKFLTAGSTDTLTIDNTTGNVGINTSAATSATQYELNVTGKLWIEDGGSSDSVLVGKNAGLVNTATGITALGSSALIANTTGTKNTAVGFQALTTISTGTDSTAMGYKALSLSTGINNTAIGSNAMASNSTGSSNVGIGYAALDAANTGSQNVAVGTFAASANTSGAKNTGIGYLSLGGNLGGAENTAVGNGSLQANTSGNNNTAVGYLAGNLITTGTDNTLLGNNADVSVLGAINQIVIGGGAVGTADNQITLGNSSVTQLVAGNYVFDIDQTLGAGQDGYPLAWDNASGHFAASSMVGSGLGGIYSGSGTVPTSVVATLTDDITFSSGNKVVVSSASPILQLENPSIAFSANQQSAFGNNATTFYRQNDFSGTNGGAILSGYQKGAAANSTSFLLEGFVENDPSGVAAVVRIDTYKHDGAGALTSVGNSGRLLGVNNNGTPVLTLLGSGNVGIGSAITAPSELLEVGGTIKINNTTASATFNITNSNNTWYQYGLNATNNFIIKPGTNEGFILWQDLAGADIMAVDTANQRLGIGIIAPTFGLHVVGTASIGDASHWFETNGTSVEFNYLNGASNSTIGLDSGGNFDIDINSVIGNNNATDTASLHQHIITDGTSSTNFSFDKNSFDVITTDGTDTNTFVISPQKLSWEGAMVANGQVTDSQVGTVNDWTITNFDTAYVVELTGATPLVVTSLAGGANGREVTFWINTANTVTFEDQTTSAAGTAGNRFQMPGAIDVVPVQDSLVTFYYHSSAGRWLLKSQT